MDGKEQTARASSTAPSAPAEDNFRVQAPAVSLPKGGGAVKGIGEKFAANPVTGTGSMSIPIPTSPGRGGFGPQLSLSYDSGAGNGPFGFGWSLSLPAITRKTDKGLPRYRDYEDSDVFILSSAEDLVPLLDVNGVRVPDAPRSIDGTNYLVRRYRPRIEGLFARIERWTNTADASDVAWRSISKDNIITWYGKDTESRITDPDGTRIFSWIICQSYDDKGNAMAYSYLKENDDSIDKAQANERNRTTASRKVQRYLDRICYGNRLSTLDNAGQRPAQLSDTRLDALDWMFEVVFDYELGYFTQEDPDAEKRVFAGARIDAAGAWPARKDPFSSHRSGWEVRTYRLCRRVLMFHHFQAELGTPDCLVRSTEFNYKEDTVASFITSVTQSGFVRQNDGRYLKRSMPPVEFTYSEVKIDPAVRTLDAMSMENLPIGIDGGYQFVDLDGEGSSGVLTEQGDAWYYKPPLGDGQLGGMTPVARKPNASLAAGSQLLDLAGDGQLDLANFRGPVTGFYERTDDADWETLRAFRTVPNIAWDNPNLRFVDVNGDGHADVLITEHQAITWYPSLAEDGFDAAERVTTPFDEEKGPALVFADGTQSIYLADMCGDGLTDLVRIRNGEVCYWPNLGFGRFGAKVTCDNSPWFDHPDQFDQTRVRIADIDGSGNIDILYLAADRVRVFLNQCGNSFKEDDPIAHAFPYDNLKNVTTADMLGKGTACLVWTSSLPGDARTPMKFIDLMSQGKPHLLVKTENNLGAETVVHYKPSTYFYFKDKQDGKPWITRLAFPVHVVERVETYDRISRNRFVTRYAYHHGYFDGEEREFHVFGMVEQWDTEEFASLSTSDAFPTGDNIDASSHVPPMHTKTWFHTGAFLGGDRISRLMAHAYFREATWNDAAFEARLLPDTVLPDGLSAVEAREAVRSLKGSILRQEVYADDGGDKAHLPYSVSERNYTIKRVQPRGANKHAVFFTHANETIDFHYERNTEDPRIGHSMTLEVDKFGNVLQAAAIGYGRKKPDTTLDPVVRTLQERLYATFTVNEVTAKVERDDDWRTPLPAGSTTYELAGLKLSHAVRLTKEEVSTAFATAATLPYETEASYASVQKRVVEQLRTIYRKDDLSCPLPYKQLEPLALPYESYKLAFTTGLAKKLFVDSGKLAQTELDGVLANEGKYSHADNQPGWWISSSKVFYDENDATELATARTDFFLPRRFEDPFGSSTTVAYDPHRLLVTDSRDALGNRVTVGVRDTNGNITANGNDYRVLQPRLVMDPNRNRSEVAFDALGLVVGTAVMGKPGETNGDALTSEFATDLTDAQLAAYMSDPLADPHALLQGATSRLVYDLFAYKKSKPADPETGPAAMPVFVSTIARETHAADLAAGTKTKVQLSFSYSDGFGREVQKKIQAEPGPVVAGGPDVDPRWVGSGWTIFNNKGKPVRQYEPFFSQLADHRHAFEFGKVVGVSPVLFYDPAERVVATLHPDHSWEKVVFDPWKQTTWDVNDTILMTAKTDAHVGAYFARLHDAGHSPSWYALRKDAANAAELTRQFPDDTDRANEVKAAGKAAMHADTPTSAHTDALGRTILTVAKNRFVKDGATVNEEHKTRVVLDIEGNQREVIDALGRVVMRYSYDMLSVRIVQKSMEAGARWMLNECLGKPIRSWDSRGHAFRTTYDVLRRPTASYVRGAADAGDERTRGKEILFEKAQYGEGVANAEALNLRGKVYCSYDGAGYITNEAHDFKGNLLRSARTVLTDYRAISDWSGAPAEQERFESSTTYDALNRPTAVTTHDKSVARPSYNEANLLERIEVNLQGADRPTAFVQDIDYDAKGRRESILYGNGVLTTYRYDPYSLRLRQLRSTRKSGSETLQDLRYAYDPTGNITSIRDLAQQDIFFNNQLITPDNDYTYDAVYRLIEALGREHLGQVGIKPLTHDDSGRTRVSFDDAVAMGRYQQVFSYDPVGNILELAHKGTDPTASGWTRTYTYEADSLLEQGKYSNRLTKTTLNGRDEPYAHDAHGNMTDMPHLSLMKWDFKDRLLATATQVVAAGNGVPETTWYVYDSGGLRVRKITDRSSTGTTGTRRKERLYLSSYETYREYANNGTSIDLERETLHVMDDKQRICLVETKKATGLFSSPEHLIRYQLGNQLGSSTIELDQAGGGISYEEYYPYGSTSYHMLRSGEVSEQRYRYTGKERDEENGMCYFGARYFATWIARWTAPEPSGLTDGTNLFQFVQNQPISHQEVDGHGWRDVLKGVGKGVAGIAIGVVVVAVVAGTGGAAAVAIAGYAGASVATAAAVGTATTTAIYVGASAYGGIQTGKTVYEATSGRAHDWAGEGRKLTPKEQDEAVGEAVVGVATLGLMWGRVKAKEKLAADPKAGNDAMARNLVKQRADAGKAGVGEATYAQSRQGGRLSKVAESVATENGTGTHAEPQVMPSRGGTVVVDQIPCSTSCAPKLFLKGVEARIPQNVKAGASKNPKTVARKAADGKIPLEDVTTRMVIPGQEPAPLNLFPGNSDPTNSPKPTAYDTMIVNGQAYAIDDPPVVVPRRSK